jgi:large subunit ribosomal protein L32
MAIPARHHSRSRINKRRSHHALKKANLIKCPNCGRKILPHRVCPYCGYYKGKQVIDVYKGLNKREKKVKEQEIANK